MIVCICNNVNSRAIEEAVLEGAVTVDAVRAATGASDCCGKCQFKVSRAISDTLERTPNSVQFYNAAGAAR